MVVQWLRHLLLVPSRIASAAVRCSAWRAWRAGLARLLLPVPPIAAAPVLHALMMSSLYWRVVNLGGAGEGGEKSKGGDLVITYAH